MYNGNRSVQVIANGLTALTPAELQELDAIVTPRAAVLLAKAFGPEIGELLSPLTQHDAPGTQSLSEDDLRQLMRDPRYWRDRDPRIMAAVSEGFKRLYPGTEPGSGEVAA